jgi:hypothetical protein
MKDAIHQRISYTAPNGKQYNIRKDGKVATLIVRYGLVLRFVTQRSDPIHRVRS